MSRIIQPPFAFLVPAVQNYDWGYKGKSSLVAKVWQESQKHILSNTTAIIDESKPYAELWYGSHLNGINWIKQKDDDMIKPIDEFLKQRPSYQTRHSNSDSAITLPYLLKILCNEISLSIQCHPDKQTAERLFRDQPNIYKDSNHKPEISLALSDSVEAMCGFRPWNEIANAINNVSEISQLLGFEWMSNHSKALQHPESLTSIELAESLKATFKGLMKRNDCSLAQCLTSLLEKCQNYYLQRRDISETLKTSFRVFAKLHREFPGDVGCLAPFFLNHVTVQPGECFFIGPNVLHGYLQGQIIECMSCSDNVIRAGLTSKFKDVDLLLELLDYSPYQVPLITPELLSVSADSKSLPTPKVLLYDPQIGDFRLYLIHVPIGSNIATPLTFKGDSAAILTILKGKADIKVQTTDGSSDTTGPITQGYSLLLPLNSSITVTHTNPIPTFIPSTSSLIPPIRFNDMLEGKQDDADFIAVVAVGDQTAVVLRFKKQ